MSEYRMTPISARTTSNGNTLSTTKQLKKPDGGIKHPLLYAYCHITTPFKNR